MYRTYWNTEMISRIEKAVYELTADKNQIEAVNTGEQENKNVITQDKKPCNNCGKQIDKNAKFCCYCGQANAENESNKKVCPRCGKMIEITAKYCCFCGNANEIKASTDNLDDKIKNAEKYIMDNYDHSTKVQAVQKYRELTGAALKEAKEAVDRIFANKKNNEEEK